MQMNKVDKKEKKPKGFGRRQLSEDGQPDEGAKSDGANFYAGSKKKNKLRGGSNGSGSPG